MPCRRYQRGRKVLHRPRCMRFLRQLRRCLPQRCYHRGINNPSKQQEQSTYPPTCPRTTGDKLFFLWPLDRPETCCLQASSKFKMLTVFAVWRRAARGTDSLPALLLWCTILQSAPSSMQNEGKILRREVHLRRDQRLLHVHTAISGMMR